MNIVVYVHSMELGGSQNNAIDLAHATQSLGHNVVLLGEDGVLAAKAERLGLEHIRISQKRRRPSPSVMGALSRLVRHRSVDIVHGYEWPPAIDAWLGPHRVLGTPVIATVMSVAVAPFLPRTMPLVVGVDALRRQCLLDGFETVDLIEPPVDVQLDHPQHDGSRFRSDLGVSADELLVVVVGRLVPELKLEGLLTACRTIARLAEEGRKIRLLIVGDGPARPQVEVAARAANAQFGSPVVMLTGQLDDPRSAYAAADIMLGMGGSALRGLAFGKPLIVQGEAGFWRLCDPSTVSEFLDKGWYGRSAGEAGDAALSAALIPLIESAERREHLGRFGRQLVVDRFSLESAAYRQIALYDQAIDVSRPARSAELAKVCLGTGRHWVTRRLARAMRRSTPADDFNVVSSLPAQR